MDTAKRGGEVIKRYWVVVAVEREGLPAYRPKENISDNGWIFILMVIFALPILVVKWHQGQQTLHNAIPDQEFFSFSQFRWRTWLSYFSY